MPLNLLARVGFQQGAERYERARPEAPPVAVDALVRVLEISERARVLEVGAGTGKLSRLVAPHAGSYVAIEPVPAMRTQFREALPGIPLLSGLAERLPLRSSTVDAVAAAQAFHWFDAPRAIAEMHRVLRPGGTVGLLWNVRDESMEWVRAMTHVIDRYSGGGPRFRDSTWRSAWAQAPGFEPLEKLAFPFVQRLDRDTTVARFTSVSFVASLGESCYREAEAAIRHLLDTHPQTAGRDKIELPYRCEIYFTRAR
jgi:SAM-dependent methyltransferase